MLYSPLRSPFRAPSWFELGIERSLRSPDTLVTSRITICLGSFGPWLSHTRRPLALTSHESRELRLQWTNGFWTPLERRRRNQLAFSCRSTRIFDVVSC